MKTLKSLSVFAFSAIILSSCYQEIIVDDFGNTAPSISLNQLLGSYDLWYVDIDQTVGYGETPFLQIAFTMSFRNGNLFANNNLVGFGPNGPGNGYGISVGNYNSHNMVLDIYHVIDGYNSFDVYQVDNNTIELYNPFNNTSYFLHGYQRSTFDYQWVKYENIHYFLQEYEAWEKTFTSQSGVLNEFDNENYLQFLSGGNDSTFRSSQDLNIGNPNSIYWDYTGIYGVQNISNNRYLKTLTLDYDFFDNEFFELTVLNDQKIELYQPSSGTTYNFTGRGYIQFMRESNTKGEIIKKTTEPKKRHQKTVKKENFRLNERT